MPKLLDREATPHILIEQDNSTLVAEMGIPQASILLPLIVKIYLGEALNTSQKLEQVRKDSDLLTLTDTILLKNN